MLDVEFVEPSVVVFTPAPVAMFTVVAAASLLMANVPVPELMVKPPVPD